MSKIVAEKQGLVLVPCGVDDDSQQSQRCRFQTRPDAACQGRQARSPGSDVTATAHVKIFEAKIRSNLTWHSNMLQTKDLSKKQIRNQKSPPRETTRREDVEKQSPEHGEVLIFGLWRLHYIGNGNRCSRCSPKDPAASCAVTSASAGKPWSIHSY